MPHLMVRPQHAEFGARARRTAAEAAALRERLERDVYVASAWHRHVDVTEKPRKLRTVKRPEDRTPAQMLVGVLNTYGTGRGSR